MKKMNLKQTELEGMNIYTDKKGQKVYLDPITKNGYVITPAKEKTFKTQSNAPLYTALVGVFSYALFDFSWWVTIIAMVVVFALLEYRFRKFLNSCTRLSNFKPNKAHQPTVYSSPDSIIYLKIVMFTALAVLLVVSVVCFETTQAVFFGSVAVAVACAYIDFKYISIIISRKRS